MINVIYDSSIDSYTAAWVISLKHPDAILHLIDEENTTPNLAKGITFIVSSFIKKEEDLNKIINSQLRTIYINCNEDLNKNLNANITISRYKLITDYNCSYSGVTWDFLFGSNLRPKIINFIEDFVLEKFKNPNTKYFIKGLESLQPTIENWNYAFSYKGRRALIQIGKDI